ncbi:hypothetical protein F5Y18DRAFT_383508 [Xylariaceae sp. FL1019]|nr:hypothetical protein F5Y18DRAFT_383508 [Xylariaceae sp. FL1019]
MAASLVSKLSRSPTRIAIVALFLFILYQLFNFSSEPAGAPTLAGDRITETPTPSIGKKKPDPSPEHCAGLEGLDDVFVTLRTGTTEAPKKLPVHFTTTLRCLPHYEIYSDFEEEIEGYHVYDSLDEVNPEVKASHPDFEYYNKLQGLGREAFTSEEIAQWASAKNTQGGRDSPGWRLDKWKFLPLAEKALRARPNAKWFIFVESDTYVLWKAMLEWLSKFDASKPWYMGQQMQIGDVIFAYGGAGFVISQPALQKVVEHRRQNLKYYDDFTANHWAGDCILGKALLDVGVPLHWSFPTVSSEEPADTDFDTGFGGPAKKPWCYYAASYHHLPPAEYSSFYAFEQEWYRHNTTLMRHKDVFWNYIYPRLSTEQSDWDNHSEDEQTSASSHKACRSACEADSSCMQFSVSGYTCRTSSSLRLGRKTSAAAEVTSGWMMNRLDAYVARLDAQCDETRDWILPN